MPLQIANESLTAVTATQATVVNFDTPITEGSTADYVLALQVSGGGTLDNTDISAATLTYYNEETKSVINDRSNQDILGAPGNVGANDVVISVASEITWSLQAEDTVFVDPTRTKRIEWHRAVFTVTYDTGSGAEVLIRQVRFPIKPVFSPDI